MPWDPTANQANASSADFNNKTAAGVVRFADAAEQTAAESNSTMAFPVGGWAYRVDTQQLIQRTATGWDTVLDLAALRAEGRPWLDFYRSETGPLTGRMQLSGAAGSALFLYDAASVLKARLTIGSLNNPNRLSAGANIAGTAITNIAGSFGFYALNQLAEMRASGNALINAAVLQLQQFGTPANAPTLMLGTSAVAANRLLGTDAAARLTSLPQTVGYPSFMPTTLGAAGQVLTAGATAAEWAAAAGGGGVDVTEVATTAIGSGSSSTSPAVALPADYATDNRYVYIEVTSNNRIGSTRLRVAALSALTGNTFQEVGSIAIRGYSTGRLQFNPTSRQMRFVGGSNPRITYVSLLDFGGGSGGGGGGSSTWVGLADTPSSIQASGWVRGNAAGDALEMSGPPTFTPAADSITAAMARASTNAYRQEWWSRLQVPHLTTTLSHDDFSLLAGDRPGQFQGFLTSPVTGSINGSSTGHAVTIGATTLTITGLYQITAAGGTQNNIALRFSTDPGTAINAEWQLTIGNIVFNFSAATKSTAPTGVTYTWTGNAANILEGGQGYACSLRVPLVDRFLVGPLNFSQLVGTLARDQFRNNTIDYTRAIGGALTDQAGWRTIAGFAAFTNNASQVLKYVNNQVVQEALDLTSLSNFGPSAEPSAGVLPVLMKWGPSGLQTIDRLTLADLPRGTAAAQILEYDGTNWQLRATPSGGSPTTATWSNLGRMPATYANMPQVSATDNGKILGVASGNWSLYLPTLSGWAGQLPIGRVDGVVPVAQIPSSIPFDRLDLNTADKATAARTLLRIVAQGAATPANDSITARQLALYTGAGDTAPTAPAEQRVFQQALGVSPNLHDLNVLETMSMTIAHSVDGRGFSLSSVAGANGGALTNSAWTIDGQALEIIELIQLSSGNVEISITGNLTTEIRRGSFVFDGGADVLHISDAEISTGQSDTNFPAGKRSFTLLRWPSQTQDIIYRRAATTVITVDFAGPLDMALDEFEGGFRTLPAYPTGAANRVLVGANSAARWGGLRSTFQEAKFTSTINTAQRSNQDPVTLTPSVTTANAALFSVSGQAISVLQDGNYNIILLATPRVSNEGLCRLFVRRNNRDLDGASLVFGERDRGRSPGRAVLHAALSRGDTLLLQYLAEEVTPASGSAPTGLTGTRAVKNSTAQLTELSWTTTAARVDRVHYRTRPAGTGGTNWGERQTIYSGENSVTVRWPNSGGADVQIWLEDDHATTGGYSLVTTYNHTANTFVQETSRTQTVDAIVDLLIGRSDTEAT